MKISQAAGLALAQTWENSGLCFGGTLNNGPHLHTSLCQTYKGGLHVLAGEVQEGETESKHRD